MINLSPATIRKKGASFDLPIATAVLTALGKIPQERLKSTLLIGELGLDGRVLKVPGILPIVTEAKKIQIKACILPKENAEGALAGGVEIIGVETLEEAYRYLKGEKQLLPFTKSAEDQENAWGRKYWILRIYKGRKL